MTQYEQENDLGRGGGEVDDETLEQGWRDAEARTAGDVVEPDDPGPEPWAKTSSGDADEV